MSRGLKICRGCKQKQPVENFYVNTRMRDGHLSYCKNCVRIKAREWRDAHPDIVKAKRKAYAEAHPGLRKEVKKTWNRRNPEKVRAKSLAQHIPCPNVCERCGETRSLHRHHPDYDKPREVIFVCQPCHVSIHKEARF